MLLRIIVSHSSASDYKRCICRHVMGLTGGERFRRYGALVVRLPGAEPTFGEIFLAAATGEC